MSNGAGLEQLRQEFIGLFDRIVEAARADERAATQSILQDTLARLAGAVGVPPPVPAPPPISRPVRVQHFAELDASQRGKRARSGFVREAAERILSASPIPLSPQKIVGLGAQQGITLKESSVRMALMSLREGGKVEQVTRSDWRMSRRDDSLFGGASQAADVLQDSSGEPDAEEVDVA